MAKRQPAPAVAAAPPAPDTAQFVRLMETARSFRRFAALAKVAEAHDGEIEKAHAFESMARERFGREAVDLYIDAHAPPDPWIEEKGYDPLKPAQVTSADAEWSGREEL